MCASPLQILIAEKIIELNPEKDFYLIFTRYSTDNQTKFNYYFDRLSKRCCKSLNWVFSLGLKNFASYRYALYKLGLNLTYDELYLSNIERRHFQYFISQCPKAKIYTFDDGMGNINPLSKFHLSIRPPLLKRSVWKVLGVNHYMEDIRKRAELHYTIYKNIPNIIDKTQYIKLFNDVSNNNSVKSTENINIYLGQPLFDIDPRFTDSFILNVLKDLNIDYYYPHPREANIPQGDFEIIESEMIGEDYIIKLLEDNPNANIRLYSFISSVIINLAHIDRIEAFYIYDAQLQEKFNQFYTIANIDFGIRSISVSLN